MIEQNKELFDEFKWVHDHYSQNPKTWQRTYNLTGEKVLEVIRKYENILCGRSEVGGYGKFTTNLSEKFQQEIKTHFPKFNHIGLLAEE